MRVTAQMLRDRNACEDQVAIFEREWPDGVNVGIRAARKAVKLGLDLEWFAETFLPPAAWADYEKAIAPAWADYEKATAAARAEYRKATAAAWVEYDKATAAARAEYDKAKAAAVVAAIAKAEGGAE